MSEEIFEPTTQPEYVATLAKLEAAVTTARHRERDLVVARIPKLRALNAATAAWVAEHPRLSHVECLKAVSLTRQMVLRGELPSAPIAARPNLPVDQYPRGRGFYDSASGRILHSSKAMPKPAPTNTRPMHADGAIVRGGIVR